MGKGKSAGRFVMLPNFVMDSPAWAALSPSARCVHLALIRRFKGNNNGKLYLPTREAADALGMSRNTVAKAQRELETAGFTVETKGAHLGSDGKGKASCWRLTHLPANGKPPTLDFKQKQNPGTKTVPPWHKNRAISKVESEPEMPKVAQKPCHISPIEWHKNRANLRYSHRHVSESDVALLGTPHCSECASGKVIHATKVFKARKLQPTEKRNAIGAEAHSSNAMPLSSTKNSPLARAARGR